jgi:hypothetical protein
MRHTCKFECGQGMKREREREEKNLSSLVLKKQHSCILCGSARAGWGGMSMVQMRLAMRLASSFARQVPPNVSICKCTCNEYSGVVICNK